MPNNVGNGPASASPRSGEAARPRWRHRGHDDRAVARLTGQIGEHVGPDPADCLPRPDGQPVARHDRRVRAGPGDGESARERGRVPVRLGVLADRRLRRELRAWPRQAPPTRGWRAHVRRRPRDPAGHGADGVRDSDVAPGAGGRPDGHVGVGDTTAHGPDGQSHAVRRRGRGRPQATLGDHHRGRPRRRAQERLRPRRRDRLRVVHHRLDRDRRTDVPLLRPLSRRGSGAADGPAGPGGGCRARRRGRGGHARRRLPDRRCGAQSHLRARQSGVLSFCLPSTE